MQILQNMEQEQKKKSNQIPVIIGELRKDFYKGIQVWCKYCDRYHKHGRGEGYRISHCVNEHSSYRKTGYIIKLNKKDKEKLKYLQR